MPRSRSLSTSSLPGNLMASWSIHNYSAPLTMSEIGDMYTQEQDPPVSQSLHEESTMEPASFCTSASDVQSTSSLKSSYIGPIGPIDPLIAVDTSMSHNIQLPSFADQQYSLSLPLMLPSHHQCARNPTFLLHSPPHGPPPDLISRFLSYSPPGPKLQVNVPDYICSNWNMNIAFTAMFEYWIHNDMPRR